MDGYLEGRVAGPEGLAVEDDDQCRRWRSELAFQRRAGGRGREVLEHEAARAEGAGRLRRERDGEQEEHGPTARSPTSSVVDEAAEPLEHGHIGSSGPVPGRMPARVSADGGLRAPVAS